MRLTIGRVHHLLFPLQLSLVATSFLVASPSTTCSRCTSREMLSIGYSKTHMSSALACSARVTPIYHISNCLFLAVYSQHGSSASSFTDYRLSLGARGVNPRSGSRDHE